MGDPFKIRRDELVDWIPVMLIPIHSEKAEVMVIGDFYRNYGYPFIRPGHGGMFAGVLEALDLVMKLAGPKTTLAPGHRDMILDLQAKVRRMVNDSKSLQDALAAKLTSPYGQRVPGSLAPLPEGLGTSADRFVGALYAESLVRNSHSWFTTNYYEDPKMSQ